MKMIFDMKRWIALCMLCVLTGLCAADLSAKVIKVYDGDTIKVEDFDGGKFKVRFADIDAPEISQPYGNEARQFLSSLLLGKAVSIHYTQIDMYGRIVGTVYLDNSESINAVLVRHGFAWWYRTYSRDSTYELIESSARAAHAGLWQSPDPVPPWKYRKARKK